MLELGVQLVERGYAAYGNVVNLIDGFCAWRAGGQQIGLHHVGDVAKVSAGFSVAIDVNRLVLDHAGDPLGDDCGIGAFGVLAWAKHIEVAQADALQAVGFAEHIGIELVNVFGDGVGAQGFADFVFDFGQAWVVAIGAAAGGVDKAFNFRVARSNKHVEKASDVAGVGGDGVFHAAGHAA